MSHGRDHDELVAAIAALPSSVRALLASRWTEAALDEHASIASFSRFSLHLMSVGAPPALLEGAHQAALDELRHARLCFELAGLYEGEPLAPGPLPLAGDPIGSTKLADVAAAAVREGCIAETLAALEARHAADGARYVAVRSALNTIAIDEEQHAALAWRFVAWALETGDADVRREIRRAFSAALDTPMSPDPALDEHDGVLAAHGKLGAHANHRIRREAIEVVLRPTVAAMGL